jgi:hypothetical protein
MSTWDDFPSDYRAHETGLIREAVLAGECVSIVGLSGAGKSNLLAYLARTAALQPARPVLVDGNRLAGDTPEAFLDLMARALRRSVPLPAEAAAGGERNETALEALEAALDRRLRSAAGSGSGLCFLLDLSRLVDRSGDFLGGGAGSLASNLRALRDAHKYTLTYVAATRHPLPDDNELAELFFGRTLLLGPLAAADAAWNVRRYAARAGRDWPAETVERVVALAGGYPALLRAVCEAHAEGAPLTAEAMGAHPAVGRRLDEFWKDAPEDDELQAAGLNGIALVMAGRPARIDAAGLTAKEHALLRYLQGRPGEVSEKDDVIRAVWPEDQIFERGVRDDSLAQLVRRLREKIELDPANPKMVHTVPGRGYRFTPPESGRLK